MPILDPSFRESLRVKRAKTSPQSCNRAVKDVTDRDNDGADEPDRIPATVGDPNDDIDPDDSTESGAAAGYAIAPPPPMPAEWWVHVVLGNPDDLVSSEDVRLVFWHIRHRLAGQEAATGAFAPSADGLLARLSLPECQNSGRPDMRALLPLWNENPAFPETVGQLHEAVESLGPAGWTAFTACWCEACGIEAPKKEEKRKQKPGCVPCPTAEPDGNPAAPLLPLPADAPNLEPGLHAALPTMNPRAVAFLLHTPRDPQPWFYRESLNERAQREQLEAEGCWTG
jgi:hypothetical protein